MRYIKPTLAGVVAQCVLDLSGHRLGVAEEEGNFDLPHRDLTGCLEALRLLEENLIDCSQPQRVSQSRRRYVIETS